jgi:hypothetical protein
MTKAYATEPMLYFTTLENQDLGRVKTWHMAVLKLDYNRFDNCKFSDLLTSPKDYKV